MTLLKRPLYTLILNFSLAIVMCAGQATFAADVFNKQQPRPFKLADALEPDATIGGYPIWKNDGKWRLLDLIRRESTGSAEVTTIGDAKFFQTAEKKLIAVMTVSANLNQRNVRWTGEPCKREDMLYKANIGRSVWEDNCVTLNHIANYAQNPGGKDAELYAMFKEQGVDTPQTVLQFQFTRNGTQGNFYHVRISINPEAYGFAKDRETWGRSGWNKTMSFNDPAKKAFIDALSAWGLNFAKQMDAALEKNQEAFYAVTPLSSLLKSQQPATESKPKVTLD